MGSSQMHDVAEQYDFFQKTIEGLEKKKKYLNYGYSTKLFESLDTKQEQLCLKVFEAANIQPDDTIVDVGFGSGEQDFLLAKKYEFAKLIGFNISKMQVEYARKRAAAEKLSDKLTFFDSAAENMETLSDHSIDKMVAVECAFYFNRPLFYKEASRVLKKGAYLVAADISLSTRLTFLTKRREIWQRLGSDSENKKLWEKHFNTVSVTNINKRVFPGAQMAALLIMANIFRKIESNEKKTWLNMALASQVIAIGVLTNLINYNIITLENK